MSVVNVTNIRLGNNPSPISAPFVFEICFEALTPLKEDLEWRVVYVGSSECEKTSRKVKKEKNDKAGAAAPASPAAPATAARKSESAEMEVEEERKTLSDEKKDEEAGGGDYLLDSVMLGPIERGVLAFEFAVNPPDYTQMDPSSVLGMQAVLVCALYKQQEFMRIGYYLNNAYSDTVLRENPPDVPLYDKLIRCIVDEPRVTRFPIVWDEEAGLPAAESEAPAATVPAQEAEKSAFMASAPAREKVGEGEKENAPEANEVQTRTNAEGDAEADASKSSA
ncbi:anti-silencing protein, ASF1 family protein [Besnoitia besnoiti]|uniref:Anti-silencing protein, ASF1 family protein n=1 Tax=Besnoitia besnoiti TaxID=94643 RepID=A0A2A9M1I1_BESBE|nr:anti-silencing protein, ASF1 family protein [Besnoitia besnoiti]PFH31845.1 anti-silencing protein, ASF1 family protein [Besnoitia besnoiti]